MLFSEVDDALSDGRTLILKMVNPSGPLRQAMFRHGEGTASQSTGHGLSIEEALAHACQNFNRVRCNARPITENIFPDLFPGPQSDFDLLIKQGFEVEFRHGESKRVIICTLRQNEREIARTFEARSFLHALLQLNDLNIEVAVG